MSKTRTTPFDIAGHLRTPAEMVLYLEATMEESSGDAAAIAQALGGIGPWERFAPRGRELP